MAIQFRMKPDSIFTTCLYFYLQLGNDTRVGDYLVVAAGCQDVAGIAQDRT